VAFGTSFGDNNTNKMFGGRIGVVRGPSFEAYVSGFHAMYDEGDYLDYVGGALSVELRRGSFELRGEGVATLQEVEFETEFRDLKRQGIYVQASNRFDQWEPVARYGWLSDARVAGTTTREAHQELALGLVRWLQPSVPIKLAYEFHEGLDDRLTLQWAYGF
jgi:hypothetical protein